MQVDDAHLKWGISGLGVAMESNKMPGACLREVAGRFTWPRPQYPSSMYKGHLLLQKNWNYIYYITIATGSVLRKAVLLSHIHHVSRVG